jgi:hypothetical protein
VLGMGFSVSCVEPLDSDTKGLKELVFQILVVYILCCSDLNSDLFKSMTSKCDHYLVLLLMAV